MKRFRAGATPLALAILACGSLARAQGEPDVGYVYPAGAQRGTVCEVTVGGERLDGVSGVYVSGQGVSAEVIEHVKPPTRREVDELKEKLKALRDARRPAADQEPEGELESEPRPEEEGAEEDGGGASGSSAIVWRGMDLTAMSRSELVALRTQLMNAKRQPNPQIAERVRLRVTIAPDAAPGQRELRLVTPAGVSDPLRFRVGRWPEHNEAEPNDRAPDSTMPSTTPLVVNGQILPGDVDRFRFEARAGERLVVAASARELIPFLADAVPGWFQATLALHDARGVELAYSDDYRFHPDPVLFCEIPADGSYVLEIKDAIYRGREDFVYRIAIGELPFVTSIFPLGGRAGEPTSVAVDGWNLSAAELTIALGPAAPGVAPIAVGEGERASNAVPFARQTSPECFEAEPNDDAGQAQLLALPVVVNGRIDPPGDRDVFVVAGRAGDELVAEVLARRLDSPLDSVLVLTDEDGRELAANDDHEDRAAGLSTHQADSRLTLILPADGRYHLHLRDAQHQGGEAFGYRLRVSPPRPDFELFVVPSSLNLRAGGTVSFTVHAVRRDGFAGAIELELKDAPAGFVLSGGRVPAGQDRVRLTLTVPAAVAERLSPVSLEGRAAIAGREVRRVAVPAEERTQAFVNRHLVPAEDLLVAVTRRGRVKPPIRLVGARPVRLPLDGTAEVRLRGPRRPAGVVVQLELDDPPAGITIESVTHARLDTVVVLRADAAEAEPGLEGNLIIAGFLELAAKSGVTGRESRKRRLPLGTLPAIPFEIVSSE